MEQLELFSFPGYKITKPIRLIELFGGIGSQAMALRNIGANFEHYRLCEFDKYAVASYNAIHGTDFPVSDIRDWTAYSLGISDRDSYEYLLTYSFPCTDLSLAGRRLGMAKGSGTRSGLLWEVERLLNECGDELPQVLLMENVPQVLTAVGFQDWLQFLKNKGYQNHYKVLNAKDYGVAQNRERCFMISILSKDFVEYDFPSPVKLTKTVVDYLEDEVEEKYYINNEKARQLIIDLANRGELPTHSRQTDRQTDRHGIVSASTCQQLRADLKQLPTQLKPVTTRELSTTQTTIRELLKLGNVSNETSQAGSVYDPNGLAPTLCACTHGYAMGNILVNK